MPVNASSRTVTFGEFTADIRLKELRRLGIRLRLPGQPFAVLAMLLERAGEVVTREELRAHLWQEETFVDFDHSLNVAISRIREVLCDSAERPRFIETIPRVGYRFIAKIEPPATAAQAQDSRLEVPGPGERENASAFSDGSFAVGGSYLEAAPVTPVPESIEGGPWEKKTPAIALWFAAALFLLGIGLSGLYLARRAFRHPVPAPQARVMLAVLPFDNLTGNPANEYLSDGLTEEMITQLAELDPQRLGVIARTSVMSLKHDDKDLRRIAGQLGVQYILEGSLRESSDRARITAQLIEVKDQTHIWADEYDRRPEDILTLEREVAGNVARAIQLELTPERRATLAQARPVDPEAHEMYLKGRYFWNERTPEGFERSVGYFQEAIRKDPNYAEAYVGLADAYRFLMNMLPPQEVIPLARAAAEKALTINPDLAEAHASLGLIDPYYDWDWEGARKHLERALELNPNSAITHDWYADGYLSLMGRLDESLAELQVAHRLDPLSCVINGDIGKTLMFARRYDEAIAQLRSVLDMDPNCYVALIWLRSAYTETGQYKNALSVFQKERNFFYNDVDNLFIQAEIFARMGRTRQARQFLALVLKAVQKQHRDPGNIAGIYIALGDKDQAFAWLEKAYNEHSNYMSSLKVWALYDPLRSDPRFVDLERRVKLIP